MTRLLQDTETRSTVDLPRAGAYAYAEHPATEVICLSWAVDDGPVRRWNVLWGEPMPPDLHDLMLDPAVTIVAHASQFEWCVEVMSPLRPQPFLPREVVDALRPRSRWDCTASRAAAVGLPRALEKVGVALRLPIQKDMDGHKLMMKMCRPRAIGMDGRPQWFEAREDVLRLGDYCDRDVETERMLDRALPALSPFERRLWQATEEMNARGILVDQKLLGQMVPFVGQAESDLNARLRVATCPLHVGADPRACKDPNRCQAPCGCVPRVSNHLALRKWLIAQGYEEVEDTGIGKDIVAGMLEAFAERDTYPGNGLSDEEKLVRDVLLLRQEGGKSSTAKYRAILSRLNADGRIRGTMIYCGAASTSRFSSTGAQLQNMPRAKSVKDLVGAAMDIRDGMDPDTVGMLHGSPLVVAAEALRPSFVAADDCWLARGDFSQIESRTIAWLAGQDTTLNAFRAYDKIVGLDDNGKPVRGGPDVYRTTAALIFGVTVADITTEQRQTGKVSILACGFGGSIAALRAMCKLYGVKMTDETMTWVVGAWREANPLIVRLWRDLEDAAFRCVRGKPGVRWPVGARTDVWFQRTRVAMGLRMPSGRSIVYWYPRIEKRTFPWGERDAVASFGEDNQTKQWKQFPHYGGLYAANLTQSFAREPMAYALVDFADMGYRPILTVHDEDVCEMPKAMFPRAADAAEAVRAVMTTERPWMRGLPIAVDASAGPRYFH